MIKLTQVNIAINASSDIKGNMLECDFKFAVELVSEIIVVDRSVDATWEVSAFPVEITVDTCDVAIPLVWREVEDESEVPILGIKVDDVRRVERKVSSGVVLIVVVSTVDVKDDSFSVVVAVWATVWIVWPVEVKLIVVNTGVELAEE